LIPPATNVQRFVGSSVSSTSARATTGRGCARDGSAQRASTRRTSDWRRGAKRTAAAALKAIATRRAQHDPNRLNDSCRSSNRRRHKEDSLRTAVSDYLRARVTQERRTRQSAGRP
jgi:hypothetical protein